MSALPGSKSLESWLGQFKITISMTNLRAWREKFAEVCLLEHAHALKKFATGQCAVTTTQVTFYNFSARPTPSAATWSSISSNDEAHDSMKSMRSSTTCSTPWTFESDRRKKQARFALHAMRSELAPPSLLLCRLCHCHCG